MNDSEVLVFQTPPVQQPQTSAVWGDVLKALVVEDPNLKSEVLRVAENLFARISKQGLLRQLQKDKIPFQCCLTDDLRWSPTTSVRSIYDAIVFSVAVPDAETKLSRTAKDFFGRIVSVAQPDWLIHGGGQPIVLLDALSTKIHEFHEGVFSFSWKQKVGAGIIE